MKLRFAELLAPLFLSGTNLGLKLQPQQRTGLDLTYDRANRELLVTYNGRTAIIPMSNVNSMEEDKSPAVKPVAAAHVQKGPVKAQASVPPGMKNE
jgi:hypothetical protein